MEKRLQRLPLDLYLAALAAIFLIITMFFPWYEKSYVPAGTRVFAKVNLNAFQVFTWVEGAILLVALAIVYLIFTRSQGKKFRLPGGDGLIIVAAGIWIEALLVYRIFDRPGAKGESVTVGIQWGIFFALVAGAAIIAIGGRIRAAGEGTRPISPLTHEPRGEADVIPDEPATDTPPEESPRKSAKKKTKRAPKRED